MDNDFFIEYAGTDDEIFKPLKGYEEYYTISSKGYIISTRTDYIPKIHINANGYFCVNVYAKGKQIDHIMHNLVASTFLEKPITKEKIVVDHINRIKTDNRLENLRYCTHAENMKNKENIDNSFHARIVCKLDSNGKVLQKYNSMKEAAIKNGLVNGNSIFKCCKNPDKNYTAAGFRWRYSSTNKTYDVELQPDEIFKKLYSKEHNLLLKKYEISNYGTVRIIKTKKVMKPYIIGKYYHVQLTNDRGKKKSIKVHRLVAFIFLEKEENTNIVNHIDEDKLNNYVDNLEWTTHSGNSIHSFGKAVYQFDLETDKLLNKFITLNDAAKSVSGSTRNISSCCHGRQKTSYGYNWSFNKNLIKK